MRAQIPVGVLIAAIATTAIAAAASGQEWKRAESRDRATELVGFVQPEQLYWRPFSLDGVQAAEFKLLSFDESSGARTLLVRLPAGWKQAPGYHSSDLEMFVVEGGVSMNGEHTGRYSYAYYPAGYAHGYGTEAGATVLQWWSGKPDFVAAAQSRRGTNTDVAIEGWRFGDAPYIDPAKFPEFRDEPFRTDSPIRMKLLRRDARTGAMTWVVMTPGGGPSMSGEGHLPPWMSAASWQEGYLLAGDMTTAECLEAGQVAGTYAPGGYFFRPAGMRHGGPSHYSTTFSIWLYRSGPGFRVGYHDACSAAGGQGR